MNRTEQTASCPQSGSSRAGPPGQTHQRTTQSSTCKGGWPLSGSRAPDASAPPCETLASAQRGPGQGSLVNPDALGPVPSENVHAGHGREHCRCGRDTRARTRGSLSSALRPLRGQRGTRVTFFAAEGSPGLTSGDQLILHSGEVGSMPLRDQAGLYSPRSSAGASPDCSGIQPLRSRHAARSHERGRKRANTECG